MKFRHALAALSLGCVALAWPEQFSRVSEEALRTPAPLSYISLESNVTEES